MEFLDSVNLLYLAIDEESKGFFPKSRQEAGIRWEKRKGKRYQRIQWKWKKKSLENGVDIFLGCKSTWLDDNSSL